MMVAQLQAHNSTMRSQCVHFQGIRTNNEERVPQQVHDARIRDHSRVHVGVLRGWQTSSVLMEEV